MASRMLTVDVQKKLGDFALNAKFTAARGVTALFGRSGSGKTSIIGAIAGLLRPDRGRISIDDDPLFDDASGLDVPAYRRRLGYVFQDGRLFPHLSVARNLDYGRWMSGLSRDAAKFRRITELLDIAALLKRRPGA